MVMPRKISDENAKVIMQMWAEGYLKEEIAERFGVSVGCVSYYLNGKHKGETTAQGLIHRKYSLSTVEAYDKARITYHFRKGEEYLNALLKKLNKRFPDYKKTFDAKENDCKKKIQKAIDDLNNILDIDWDKMEKECKDKWRSHEREYRKRNGKSSMDRLYRVKLEEYIDG
jgi:predicted transcriptional regulator